MKHTLTCNDESLLDMDSALPVFWPLLLRVTLRCAMFRGAKAIVVCIIVAASAPAAAAHSANEDWIDFENIVVTRTNFSV
jgi:hypothetical protein